MTAQDLKNSILQLAIQGKLVEQRAEEGTAQELLTQIKVKKEQIIKGEKIKKEKPLPKITENEIPFEIPESWEWVRLGKIGSLARGSGIKRTETIDKGFSCVRYGELYTTYKTWFKSTVSFISEELYRKCQKVQKGDVLMTLTGENKTDIATAVAYLGEDDIAMGGDMACWSNHFMEPLYLVYLLNSAYCISCKRKMATGDIIVHISIDKLATILLPIPPLAEQRRIVDKIEELLPYIEKYDKTYSRLETFNKKFPEDMQKSILQYAMQGKLVEQRPEEGTGEELYCQIQIEKEKLIKAGIIKKEKPFTEITEEEKPFKIPKSWKWVKLNSIVEVITDGDHQPPPQVEAGVPFLVISNMSQGNLSFMNTRNVSQEYYDALQESRKPQNGDILFTVTGSYGIVIPIKTDKAFCVQRHIAIIKKPFVSVDYLVKCLSSPYSYKQCKKKATGTAQKTVGLETLRNLILPLPPLAEQERIVTELEKVLPYCQQIVK